MAELEDLRQSAPAEAGDQRGAEESVSERAPSQRIVDRIAVWQERVAMGRELVTSGLAVVIVLTTLGVVVAGVFWVHDAGGRAAVKDTLIFLNGLVGVILGYYFGRVPGESRAERSEGEAREARGARDHLVAGIREVLASAGVEPQAGAAAPGGSVTLSPRQVERLRRLLAGG